MSGGGVAGIPEHLKKMNVPIELEAEVAAVFNDPRDRVIEAGSGKIKKRKKVMTLFGIPLKEAYWVENFGSTGKAKWEEQEKLINNISRGMMGLRSYWNFIYSFNIQKESFANKFYFELEKILGDRHIPLPRIADEIFSGGKYHFKIDDLHGTGIQRYYITHRDFDNIQLAILQLPKRVVKASTLKKTLINNNKKLIEDSGLSHDNLYLEIFFKIKPSTGKSVQKRESIFVPLTPKHKYVPNHMKRYFGHIFHLTYVIEKGQKFSSKAINSSVKLRYIGVYHSTKALESGLGKYLSNLGGGK